MQLLDVLNTPWAIMPDKLLEIRDIYLTHLRGEKIDIAAIEARLGHALDNQPKNYSVDRGVAVLPIEGVVAKKMNLFTRVSGGTSTQLLQNDLQAALDDDSVHSIVLHIDSPGGAVDGVEQLAAQVRAARGQKPIVALADGMMCSAAYWIGSAADKVYLASSTTQVGSIGVVATHTDVSKQEEAAGVKVTEVTAGKYKRIASPHGPLTPDGYASMKEKADEIYTIFVNEVASNRKQSPDRVLSDMADGRVFLGAKAIDAGLADGISSLPALVEQLNGKRLPPAADQPGAVAPDFDNASHPGATPVGGNMADAKTPQQIEAETTARVTEAYERGKTEGQAEGVGLGASQECQRIKAVEAQALPGHEKLIGELKFDGKTTGPEAAEKVLAADRAARLKAGEDLQRDAPKPAPRSPNAEEPQDRQIDPSRVAAQAQDYIADQALKGKRVSASEAVAHVIGQQQAA